MKKPKFSKDQSEYLREILTPPCCHVSGEHDPVHFKEQPKKVCSIQKARAYERALRELRFGIIPGRKEEEICGWCL